MTPGDVLDLARFVAKDGLTVDEVIARVGPVTEDHGVPLPMDLEPSLTGTREARLWTHPDSGEPYLLEVTPEPGVAPTVAGLESVLGRPRPARRSFGEPESWVFEPSGLEGRVSVTVRVASDGPTSAGTITWCRELAGTRAR
ncbi:MAG TPA: hypothetical protein VKG43_09745 [Acidimicrobiales bacterium]|nr:hypothetical protein [Acidimicrobiales bacterium]